MSLITDTGFAYKFNGISDSILIPVSNNSFHGVQAADRKRLPTSLSSFTIETWFTPDCGGVIFEQDNVMRLVAGTPSAPGPATFEVRLMNPASGRSSIFSISSAKVVTKPNGEIGYWDGILLPSVAEPLHDSYSAVNLSKNDITAFNEGHRELINLTVSFNRKYLSMFINGDLVARKNFDEDLELMPQQNHMYIGGKGGEFRGTIEAVHWSRGSSGTGHKQYGPVKSDQTLGLWRFEEPISPMPTVMSLTAAATEKSSGTSTITIGKANCEAIMRHILGIDAVVPSLYVLNAAPYSAGDYTVKKYTSTAFSNIAVPKVPVNLLLNPRGYNPLTGKPNNLGSERVRVLSVNIGAGTVVVQSIHLDWKTHVSGTRGLLMAHPIGTEAVLITGDCIVDEGINNEFQPQGAGTQFSQRQSQVCIDESSFDNHGIAFSMSMAIDSNTFNAFSATSDNPAKVLNKFEISYLTGHSGRHILNHVKSNPFMGLLPPASEHQVEKKLDVTADVVTAKFPATYADIRNIAPPNSIVTSYDTQPFVQLTAFQNKSTVQYIVENGMADIDDNQRDILALGGRLLNTDLFALKPLHGNSNDNIRGFKPSEESRVAILRLDELSTYNYAPFVQIHYNAVDKKGDLYTTKATSRISKTSTSTVLTLESIKSFGVDGAILQASNIFIRKPHGGEIVAASTTAGVTATINKANKTLTFSSATDSSFQSISAKGAIVRHIVDTPKILVEKTLPAVNTVLDDSTNYRIVDLIQEVLAIHPLELISPGGIIEFESADLFPFNDGELEGEASEGLVLEDVVDTSMCPENYLPLKSTDPPQSNPKGIAVSQDEITTKQSSLHKVMVRQKTESTGEFEEMGNTTRRRPTNGYRNKSGVIVNQSTNSPDDAGGYGTSGSSVVMAVDGNDARDYFEVGNDVYNASSQIVGTVTAVAQTSVTFGAGTSVRVVDNEELYPAPQISGMGTTNQSTAVNELFDIIEHKSIRNKTRLTVQPTDRRKFSQLSKLKTDGSNPSTLSIEYMNSKARVLSFELNAENKFEMVAHGLVSDIASSGVNVKGAGAADSQIVKEMMPGAPVVTVTLGGIGQGAVNTKETWDPSPLARLSWNTRRDCAVKVVATSTGVAHATLGSTEMHYIQVAPLNNKAEDLASWGTYCFPSSGRIYTESGASAEYDNKQGDRFIFNPNVDSNSGNKYSLKEGDNLGLTFSQWRSTIQAGDLLYVDNLFSEESMCNDGTTINDRLFQSMENVQHDYQLSTQYSSTRAMVEIPLFRDFFFENEEEGIFPGPDNTMKLHLDATHTAHTWNPNPVGRRFDARSPVDTEARSHFQDSILANDVYTAGARITKMVDNTNGRIYVDDGNKFPIPSDYNTASSNRVAGINGSVRFRRVFLPNGEWAMYSAVNTSTVGGHYLTLAGNSSQAPSFYMSENFLRDAKPQTLLQVGTGYPDLSIDAISDNPYYDSTGFEGRRSFYYDRSNVQTQGGNVDYGLRQYVSAVEFRAGPRTNPHLKRIKSKRAVGTVKSYVGNTITFEDASDFPTEHNIYFSQGYYYRLMWTDASGASYCVHYASRGTSTGSGNSIGTVHKETLAGVANTSFNPAPGDKVTLIDLHRPAAVNTNEPRILPNHDNEIFINKTWANPYAPGGLRHGDTVWMNMHYTNPHAIEGMFCKSRGVLNEGQVLSRFNGGKATNNNTIIGNSPRSSSYAPMENFLIGDTCIETAQNFVQHVNETIKLNRTAANLGAKTLLENIVAFVDPYQASEKFTRVLLYDINNDREFIAFQDLWMQVQSSPDATFIGQKHAPLDGTIVNSNLATSSRIDVPAGFPSQDAYMNADSKSNFVEGAYSHNSDWNNNLSGADTLHTPNVGNAVRGEGLPRTNNRVTHEFFNRNQVERPTEPTVAGYEVGNLPVEQSTMFDTPDGTRAIPAFLALKGIRSNSNNLTNENLDQYKIISQLQHWTKMDFTRRLTVDLGEVAVAIGKTNIESAAREVVRLINQAGAKNGRTHARRPVDQYLGESQRFDLDSPGPKGGGFSSETDPSATHIHADFATTGSTHDPSPFWANSLAFSSHDRGTHMGYMRAHLGRVVVDDNGKEGFSIVIHSTVPGAQGRNFCVWLDASRAQSAYQPQFLIGHGGRFRNYFCQPDEMSGENMHPAPMPINRFGRPFAPITTLQEYLPPEIPTNVAINANQFGDDDINSGGANVTANAELVTGRSYNSASSESLETKLPNNTLVKGLRVGTQAKAKVNFGGFTQAGIPGWAPDAGIWGVGAGKGDNNFNTVYGSTLDHDSSINNPISSTHSGYIPIDQIKAANVGQGNIYGMRLVDHLGKSHTIRMVYKEFGQKFSNGNTSLPSSLEKEIMIHFNDKDCSSGGFTIGAHMIGKGECTGRLDPASTQSNLKEFRGNKWNNYPSKDVGLKVTTTYDNVAETLTVALAAPYDSSSTLSHTDILGYLGFPESGLIQFSKNGNNAQGVTTSYTSRTKGNKNATHIFYGVKGYFANASDWIMSPRINFTSLLTDEVIAAAFNHAINLKSNSQDDESTYFDCTDMFAPDGRTFGEWGVDKKAIRFKLPSDDAKSVILPSKLFSSKLSKDFGLQAGAAAQPVVGSKSTGGMVVNNQRKRIYDVGYIPNTILNITTKFRGTNANTATPLIIDSQNNPIDTSVWQDNLLGKNFIDVSGDLIIPRVDSPMLKVGSTTSTTITLKSSGASQNFVYLCGAPGSNSGGGTWGERYTLWYGSEDYITVTADNSGTDSDKKLVFSVTDGVSRGFTNSNISADDVLIKNGGPTYKASKIDGVRRAGSIGSSPLTYFRGARDSPDHWVPLFFGGGFSGTVMDINDGTENDYGEFYEHPYASGPTGSCGLQNVGELAGSHAMIDTNALLAMFPGTPYLDQHKGMNHPPFFNQDALLSFDMTMGGNTKDTGVVYTDGTNTVKCTIPSPVVIRFAHPHARYSPASNTSDHTTYMIFGPGQSFPHNSNLASEQKLSNTITIGNRYSAVPINFDSSIPDGEPGDPSGGFIHLPNEIANGNNDKSTSGLGATSIEAQHLPKTEFYQKNNVSGYNYLMNWEPTKGFPNFKSDQSDNRGNRNIFSEAASYDGPRRIHLQNASNITLSKCAHPYANNLGIRSHLPSSTAIVGTSTLPHTTLHGAVWQMDGGYHPGGHFLDNHIIMNPNQPIIGSPLGEIRSYDAPSHFRPCGLLGKAYSSYYTGGSAATNERAGADYNFVLVDATRVQNAEELGTILSAAINSYPGTDPLKAIGGTFMPSMRSAHGQDRYGWVDLGTAITGATNHNNNVADATIEVANDARKGNIPEYGWVRFSNGTDSAFAPYIGFNPTSNKFTLGRNPILQNNGSGTYNVVTTNPVNPATGVELPALHTTVEYADENESQPYRIYVWTKSGVRVSNQTDVVARDTLGRVHFNGLHDAVDRTVPIGAIGWNGLPYSKLNNYKYQGDSGQFTSGLGAWHPFLGFTPYGAAENCLSMSQPVNGTEASMTQNLENACISGLSTRHIVVVSHESELPLIAKSDRHGLFCSGDWMMTPYVSNTTLNACGTVAWDAAKVHNKSRYVGPATAGPHVEAQVHAGYIPPIVSGGRDYDNYPATGSEAAVMEGKHQYHGALSIGSMAPMDSCNYPTGDLFWDESVSKASNFHSDFKQSYFGGHLGEECIGISSHKGYLNPNGRNFQNANGGLHGFYHKRSSARNFLPEHVVWKRMDGGSLTMPAVNARGLGMIPWTTRNTKASQNWGGVKAYGTLGQYMIMGEKILGNVRFSFETTNSAMFPIIQAQELSHPQLAEQNNIEIVDALKIPNEDIQFQSIEVVDDTGQKHLIKGGSPFGTVIREFTKVDDDLSNTNQGLAPALFGSGDSPNIRIRLPNPDEIPGNILVRSGFDRLQALQQETLGSGGLIPAYNDNRISKAFPNITTGDSAMTPRAGFTWENLGWEHISQDATDVNETIGSGPTFKSPDRLSFPDSTKQGSEEHGVPTQSTYEPHDRTLYFHVTKMGTTGTSSPFSNARSVGFIKKNKADPTTGTIQMVEPFGRDVTFSTYIFFSGEDFVTASASGSGAPSTTTSPRRFARVFNIKTGKGGVFSYTGFLGGTEFTGCEFTPEYIEWYNSEDSNGELGVYPSYYIPAGTTRHFASRRLRDHSEYSGASPDMKMIDWYAMWNAAKPTGSGSFSATSVPYTYLTAPKMTPMPIPRMGHHYVTPTMALLPGHYAHPAYQRMFDLYSSCKLSSHDYENMSEVGRLQAARNEGADIVTGFIDTTIGTSFSLKDYYNPVTWFSTPSAAFGPSDIHGGAFTLMAETKLKYEGYGVAASVARNAEGGHAIVLEAASSYTQNNHFPDPLEVGAYQIIIQPNLLSGDLGGSHENSYVETNAPVEGGTKKLGLTSQQVNTVIAIEKNTSTYGGYTLILSEATMVDVRGCEIIINELMLDIDPDPGSQFTNLPPLALYNPLGVQETTSPQFSRRSLPYRPGMFTSATPGYTLTTPWWSHLHASGVITGPVSHPDGITAANLRGVHITTAGSGYTAASGLATESTNGTGSGMVVTITVNSGGLQTISVTNPGTGYRIGEVVSVVQSSNKTGSITVEKISSTGWRHLEWTKPDNYYEFCRAGFGSIGAQLTLAGYPTHFLDIYEPHKRRRSLNPTCARLGHHQGNGTIDVNDNTMFPMVTYYGEKLEFVSRANGETYTATYTGRKGGLSKVSDGNSPVSTLAQHSQFTGIVADAEFWTQIGQTVNSDVIFRLSRPYDTYGAGTVYTDSLSSLTTRILPQVYNGTRDTNSLNIPDVFLCMSHPNLGRPFTWYSDTQQGGTRVDYAGAGLADSPVDALPYNHVPEHFETVHYQDFNYVASKGPFHLSMKSVVPPTRTVCGGSAVETKSNLADTGVRIDNGGGYAKQTTSAMTVDTVDPNTVMGVGSRIYKNTGELIGVITAMTNFSTPSANHAQITVTSNILGTLVALADDEEICMIPLETQLHSPIQIAGTQETLGGTLAGIDTQGSDSSGVGGVANFSGFWPGGSRGAGAVSRLETYGHALIGWGGDTYGMYCDTFQDVVEDGIGTGIAKVTLPNDRNRCFGYRFGVRQAYNRPQWAPYVRGWQEVGQSRALLGYYHGPLVQINDGTWEYVGAVNSDINAEANITLTETTIGILERITQVSSLLNQDQIGRQVRYSDGRRMTRSFGCPVRTLFNTPSVTRLYPRDSAGKAITELANAHRFYMVDWWGNTRGEEVRRFPVRSIGIRPSWDPADAYKGTDYSHRPSNNGLFEGSGDLQSGNSNSVNDAQVTEVDWFNPASMLRVGDRGDGRGARWPTVFNENLLMGISDTLGEMEPKGLVLSESTSEPSIGKGLVRPSNEALSGNEIERGISDRLDLSDSYGLLEVSASVAQGVEILDTASPVDSRLIEPVGRDGIRIGLDVDTIGELKGEQTKEYVVTSTEAVSLHTDKEVGQRTHIMGAYNVGHRTLKDLDMSTLNFAGNPSSGVVKHSNAHAFWALGGTYHIQWARQAGIIDITGWGTPRLPQNGLCLWLRADSLNLQHGDSVAEWVDESPNRHVFTQSTASARPTFVTNDADWGYRPHLSFDGNDKLELPFSASLNTNQFSLFVVCTVNSDDNTHHSIIENTDLAGLGTGNKGWVMTAVTTSNAGNNDMYQMRTGTGGSPTLSVQNTATNTLVPNDPAIISFTLAGGDGAGANATKTLFYNGVMSPVTGTYGGQLTAPYHKHASAQGYDIGNDPSYQLTGQIAEVIQYNRAVTDAERELIESYLSQKYGVSPATISNCYRNSNPIQNRMIHTSDTIGNPITQNLNTVNSSYELIYRPVQTLDKNHTLLFRGGGNIVQGPQSGNNYFRATAGGKYGIFYRQHSQLEPVFYMYPTHSTTVPISMGPKINGSSTMTNTVFTNPIAHMFMSLNTLQHFRADASRKSSDDSEGNFQVYPRYSQSLFPMGNDGTNFHQSVGRRFFGRGGGR